MHEYLPQIIAISDSLASIGSPIMLQEHIDSILEGLFTQSLRLLRANLNLYLSPRLKCLSSLMKLV